MPKFKIVTGATGGTGHFFSMLGKDEIKINPGIFKKSITLDPASVTVSTEGLQPPSKNTVRFYLRHKGDEWVCDLTGDDFAKLQAMLLKQGYSKSGSPSKKVWIIGGVIAFVLYAVFSGDKPPQTPEEIAAAAAAAASKAEEDAKKEAERLAQRVRLRAISSTQDALEASLRDPESVRYDQKSINMDNGAICFVYRAKNGFGGYSRESLVIYSGKTYQNDSRAYKRLCPVGANYENYHF